MNFVAFKMLTRNRASQHEERALAGRTHYEIPAIHEMGGSTLALVGISVVLLAGLVTTARAQATSSATYYLDRGVESYIARDFEAAIAYFSEAIEINSGFAKSPAKKL